MFGEHGSTVSGVCAERAHAQARRQRQRARACPPASLLARSLRTCTTAVVAAARRRHAMLALVRVPPVALRHGTRQQWRHSHAAALRDRLRQVSRCQRLHRQEQRRRSVVAPAAAAGDQQPQPTRQSPQPSPVDSADKLTVPLAHAHFAPKLESPPSLPSHAYALPPVLVLHGLLANANTYRSVLKRGDFAPERHVFALDLRNHGGSPHVGQMSYRAMARDVREFMTRKSIERACVLGHSMGGKLGMALALESPELVSELVVVDAAPVDYRAERHDSGGNGDGSGDFTNVNKSIGDNGDGDNVVGAAAAAGNSPTGAVARMLRVDLSKRYTSRAEVGAALRDAGLTDDGVRNFVMTNLLADEERPGRYRWRVNLHGLQRCMAELMGFPHSLLSDDNGGAASDSGDSATSAPSATATATEATAAAGTGAARRRRFDGPTLFIKGAESDYIRDEYVPRIRALFPAAELAVVHGAGHWLQSQKPDEFTSLVTKLLHRSAAASSASTRAAS